MKQELTYALITPYSLLKSRTGGIICRLLSLSDLELVGARMYTPSDKFLDEYIKTIEAQKMKAVWKKVMIDYVNNMLRKNNKLGMTNRAMLLLFEGKNAVNILHNKVIGSASDPLRGDTIRGTFGDTIVSEDGKVDYFEPAVLTSADKATNIKQLKLFAKYSLSDGGILENVVDFGKNRKPETSLIILKPFEKHDPRAGNIISMFSRTGFYIVGIKLLDLSTKQAEEFYGPVKDFFNSSFDDKFKPELVEKLKASLKQEDFTSFELTDELLNNMAAQMKKPKVNGEFNSILQYMTGSEPSPFAETKKTSDGKHTICIAILYQGINTIKTIRELLGATDPRKAKYSSIRRFYALDIRKNAVHASDSTNSVIRERKIIGFNKETKTCDIKQIINRYIKKSGSS
ncbi:nucleoside diphosphate kinase [Candidatus Scalindua japonica]|uniref:nucleoside-diphosphate kinase n=1 Tax=Candidatus Scalindua japonica TaxID=1284222 RepID=A0A286TWM3_9BACT|nr:nucleoside-diphosphate kinase [Candidatus Scalindua japonica]GAX60289.1 nucleoside diphosphate kinase [Candidatus Scalindua japonica]